MPPLKRYGDTEKISRAQDDALSVIASATSKAKDALAEDAINASKRLASDAADALKLMGTRGSDDHDLLIRIETTMNILERDIKEMKTGSAIKLGEHEDRIGRIEVWKAGVNEESGLLSNVKINTGKISVLERSRTIQTTMTNVGVGLLLLMASMLIYHLFGIHV